MRDGCNNTIMESYPGDGLFAKEPYTRELVVAPKPEPPKVIPPDYVPELVHRESVPFDITINQDRVDQVLGRLMWQYKGEQFPYNLDSTRVPQDPRHMPEHFVRGDLDKAMFLWTVCYYMRGGTRSVEAVKRLTPLYNERYELFDCSVAANVDPEVIANELTKKGLGFQEKVSNAWVENAKRMQEQWGGDPRNIFDGVTTYDESLARVMNDKNGGGFIGFKEKMTSMIIYYLTDAELIEEFPFPVPVDIHVMRVSIANELITFADDAFGVNLYTPQVTQVLRKVYLDYAVQNNVDSRELSNAVWLLSEALCGKHPGNQTLEPLGRKAREGRKTYLVPKPVDPTDPAQQRAYEASCRHCPIESTCDYTLPGKPYYIGGVLFKRGYRQRFEPLPLPPPSPQLELF